MPLPEGTKLRKGDIVAIHCEVESVFDEMSASPYRVTLPGTPSAAHYVGPEHIEGVVRRHFDPGDAVIVDDMFMAEVLAINGRYLWVMTSAGSPKTVLDRDCRLLSKETSEGGA